MSKDLLRKQPESIMIDPSYRKNRDRIEADEAELEELMKANTEGQVDPVLTDEEEAEAIKVAKDAAEAEENKKLTREEATFKKRYGDLRRHQQEQEKKWEAKFEALSNTQPKGFAAPKSNEDITAWVEKYPDVAGIVETIATQKAKEMFEQTDSRFKELDDLNYETKKAKAEGAIRETHTDFDDLRVSDEFHDWVDEQPTWMQNALYQNQEDASSVIRVIDMYKVDKGLTKTNKKSTSKNIAASVKGKTTTSLNTEGDKKFSESQINSNNDAWYEKNEKEILESMSSGNFTYDLTNKDY